MLTYHRMLIGLFALTLLVGCQPISSEISSARQLQVAERGAEVMPFDLERTTHIFTKMDNGGLQQVLSDDGDSAQIRLIREHLAEEAARFSQGDFHDPAMIHDADMAGLHELMMGADRLTIVYSDTDNGGQILYTTTDADLVSALHAWFDQQVADHGNHATMQTPATPVPDATAAETN